MTILAVRDSEPSFPPTADNPDALRAHIDIWWVDYVGTLPTLAEVLAVVTPPTTRKMLDIITDLNALTGPQKTAVWNDLNGGSTPKWSTDAGPNAGALSVLQLVATLGLSAADLLAAKIRAVAMYVQDNPTYLVNPSFDPTINIPGKA